MKQLSGNGVTIDGVTLKDNAIEGAVESTEVITGANVITTAESGKVFFLNSATGAAQTLPTVSASTVGLKYKFIISTVPTSGNMTVVTAAADNGSFEGVVDVNSAQVDGGSNITINFVASTCVIGDWVEVMTDGTYWFVTGASTAAGGITFTT
jgi:hypothetical protein